MHQKTEEIIKQLMGYDLTAFGKQVTAYTLTVDKAKVQHPVNGSEAFVMGAILGSLAALQKAYKEYEV